MCHLLLQNLILLLNGDELDPFNQFQLKIVFRSTNSAKVPLIRDLRAIALVV